MITSPRLLSALAALSLTAAPLATSVAAASPAPATPARVVAIRLPYAERHPEIRGAIRQLQRARYDLQHAAHDFGGHRVDALAATDNAIRQLQIALQYDR